MGTARRRSRVSGAAIVILLWAATCARPAGHGQATAAPDDPVATARATALTKLSDVATWCDRQRLFGSRDRVFARMLALEPDHARARAGLKYSRDTDGRWVRRSPYTAPPDWNRGLVAQADEKVGAALAGYRDAVTASVAGDDVPLARREQALDALVDLLPDDRVVRELRGDVLDGGKWKLQESIDGARRRTELRAGAVTARRAFSARRPADGTGGWTSGLVASGIRLYSTLHATVVEDVLRDTVVADAVARAVLATPPDAGAPVRVLYVLDDREQALAFIARDAKNPAQAVAEARLVSGFWLDGESYVAYHADPLWRARACPRVAIDGELRRAFPRTVGGFVVEGVGQRLLYLALDAHGPPFVTIEGTDRPGADEDESEPLPKNPREWMPRAARVLQADGGRRLAVALSARLNAMTPANVLAAYALAAYLLEARPDTLKPLVDALAESADAAKVVEDVLGGDLASLAVRVRRYALEND